MWAYKTLSLLISFADAMEVLTDEECEEKEEEEDEVYLYNVMAYLDI